MADRFTKVVLTVIAAALIWLCVVGMDVNISEVGGQAARRSLPVYGSVDVSGSTVTVDGSVDVSGSVDCY